MSAADGHGPAPDDILVVDDTPVTLKLLVDILAGAGFRVRPASDGELALRSVGASPPSLILLDVRMPGIDGYEVCRRLKADDSTRSIPVIFLSGLGDQRDKVRGFEVGGVDYLTKPFLAEEVLARVATHLSLRRSQIDLERRNAELKAASDLAARRAQQLQLLAAELTRAEECERRRIARVLHDQLQQLLVVGRIKVSRLRRRLEDSEYQLLADQLDDLLKEAINESRSLTASLSPPVLYDRGLIGGLEWLARQTREQSNLSVDFRLDPEAEPDDLNVRILLFQVARELLLNVAKHAESSSVCLQLERSDGERLRLHVEDFGKGFDALQGEQQDKSSGFGLFSIRERLELIGGTLEITSVLGQGTHVVAEVPQSHAGPAAPAAGGSQGATEGGLPPEQPRKVRVLLADDHVILRQGLAGLLREHADLEVVGEAADGQQAVDLALATHPDVILMDVSMPRLGGIEATRQIIQVLPHTRVIGLSMHEAEDMAAAMLKAGAEAYLRKDVRADMLLSAVLMPKTTEAPATAGE